MLQDSGKRMGEPLIKIMVGTCMGALGEGFKWPRSGASPVEIKNGCVSLDPLLGNQGSWAKDAMFQSCGRGGGVHVSEVLTLLAGDVLYVRRSQGRRAWANALINDLSTLLATAINCSTLEKKPWSTNAFALGVLPSGSSKPRGLSAGFRQALSKAVADDSQLRKPRHLLAGAAAMARTGITTSGPGTHMLHPKSANKFCKVEVFQHLKACRQVAKETKHFSIALGSTRGSGKAVLSAAGYSMQEEKAMWLPIQAPSWTKPLIFQGCDLGCALFPC